MRLFIQMPSENGGLWFSVFYLLSFLFCAAFLYFQGYKRKYPMPQWTLLIAAGMFVFIIGTKLFTYTAAQWNMVFHSLRFPEANGKTILGGLIMLVPGILLLKKILRFHYPVLDLVALVLPLAMALQRVGCLLNGCCFGRPTSLPWGIVYGRHSHTFYAQLNDGLVTIYDHNALPVHPTQAYQVIGCLLIALIAWKLRKTWKQPQSQLPFIMALYGLVRFLDEFLRAPAADLVGTRMVMGLSMVQWYVAAGIGLLLAITWLLEKRKHSIRTVQMKPISQIFVLLLNISCILSLFSIRNWLSPAEYSVISLFFLISLSSLLGAYCIRLSNPGFRWLIPVLLPAGMLLMAQSPYIPDENTGKIIYHEISLGGLFANYQQEVSQYLGSDGGCPDYSQPELREYNNYTLGLRYSYNEVYSRSRKFSFKLTGFFGYDNVRVIDTSRTFDEITGGISPFFQYDWNWVGIGGGFNLGKLRYADIDRDSDGLDTYEWENSPGEYNVMPQLNLRIGPKEQAYLDMNLSNNFPSSCPMSFFSVGLGSGLGRLDGRNIEVGNSMGLWYFKGMLPISEYFLIEGMAGNNFSMWGNQQKSFYSIGIVYRFDFRSLPKVSSSNL